jgi:pimeloyl-ACP methyl ester carboxylesterase
VTDDAAAEPQLVIDEVGQGRPVLILHGGGGPRTVAPISQHLAERARVITPTLPGWNGAPRPERVASAADYARAYLDHLRGAGLHDVVVIGSSLGGWITAEMAAEDHDGRIAGIVILDGAGIEVEGEPITDFSSLTPREAAERTWHDPDRFYVDPATIPADQVEMQGANMATMAAVFRDMFDPGLRDRLAEVTIPALVIWGDSDRIFTVGYGRAYAEAFANGRFELIANAGHLPQLEQPPTTLGFIDAFLDAV